MKIYRRIIFVAEAGTCRAPMAAALLKEYTLKHPVEVLARGLVVLFQEPLNGSGYDKQRSFHGGLCIHAA